MKRFLPFAFALAVFGCGRNVNTLSENTSDVESLNLNIRLLSSGEKKLCDSLGFNKDFVELLKMQTGEDAQLIPMVNEYGETIRSETGPGFCFPANEHRDRSYVLENKERYLQKGLLLFLFEDEEQLKPFVGLIKGEKETDIIRWRQTNGINYGHDNNKLIERFSRWYAQRPFHVVSVGMDFVEIQFKENIADADKFATEVYEFCPDAVDQGAGTLPALSAAIKESNGMYFWWD